MISEPALILIDEFGNTHLNLSKRGTFSHFVYSSLIIPLSRKEQVIEVLKQISKNHFFSNAVKSSNLGPAKFDRRLHALSELFGDSARLDHAIP